MAWARRRWEHGLGGLGLPWQEGEDAWLLAGQLQARAEEGAQGQAGPEQQDLPPDALADADSRWARCGALRVHYKLALPLVGARGVRASGSACRFASLLAQGGASAASAHWSPCRHVGRRPGRALWLRSPLQCPPAAAGC